MERKHGRNRKSLRTIRCLSLVHQVPCRCCACCCYCSLCCSRRRRRRGCSTLWPLCRCRRCSPVHCCCEMSEPLSMSNNLLVIVAVGLIRCILLCLERRPTGRGGIISREAGSLIMNDQPLLYWSVRREVGRHRATFGAVDADKMPGCLHPAAIQISSFTFPYRDGRVQKNNHHSADRPLWVLGGQRSPRVDGP